MRIPTTDEALYMEIIHKTTSYNGLTFMELVHKMETLRKENYEAITRYEFEETVQSAVFKLLMYGVLYMIHGYIYQHDNMLRPGDVIIDTLRELQFPYENRY